MAVASNLHETDMEFRNEVIDRLLHSVECARHFKASLGQFLANVTTDANHKHLAYHLFCTVRVVIIARRPLCVPRSAKSYRLLSTFLRRPLLMRNK